MESILMYANLLAVVGVEGNATYVVQTVADLLEVLPDLSPRFHITIVDDGSSDDTPEVAFELSRLYPQVGIVGHPEPRGDVAIMRSALPTAQGDFVLYVGKDCGVNLHDIPKLWGMRYSKEVLLSRSTASTPLGWIPWPPGKNPRKWQTVPRDLQLIRRPLLDAWRMESVPEHWLTYLENSRVTCQEVVLRSHPAPAPIWQAAQRIANARATLQHRGSPQIARPKTLQYLAKLKAFALGE